MCTSGVVHHVLCRLRAAWGGFARCVAAPACSVRWCGVSCVVLLARRALSLHTNRLEGTLPPGLSTLTAMRCVWGRDVGLGGGMWEPDAMRVPS
jgi:hypothetical protein